MNLDEILNQKSVIDEKCFAKSPQYIWSNEHHFASGKPRGNKEDMIIDIKVVAPVFKSLWKTLTHESSTYFIEMS